MSRFRAFKFLWLACILAAACVDGSGPTGAGQAVPLDIRPSFQLDPSLFPAEPVDRIRLTARDATTSEIVGSEDLPVSPTDDQWTLSLGITLGEAPSLTVVVDVELLAGDVVQWSGRLGPMTVQSGTTSPVQSVELNRGSLDDLDVIALDIVDPPTSISVGSTVVLVANPTLVDGSTVEPTVYWGSTNTAVATVTPQGLVATVTGVGAGTTQIVAAAGSVSVELDLEVTEAAPGGTRIWVGGDAAGPSDWQNANNWSPVGVPGAADSVLIRTETLAVLSADATVARLTMEPYATLDLGGFTLNVSGDVDAEQANVFNGLTSLTGAGTILTGAFDALELAASRALTGYLYVTGDLTLTDADLDVGGWLVTVGGNLQVVGANAHLIMDDPADYVSVVGDALFDGGDHTGLLSAGALVLQGDLTVTNRSMTGFAASAEHMLYFTGDVAQSADFAVPGADAQRIANLFIQSISATTFATSAHVTQDVTVYGPWTVPEGVTIGIDGTLTLWAGATLQVDGAVTATAGCTNYGGVIQGIGTHPCPPPPTADYRWEGGDTGGSPTAWENAANWQPNGVPGPNDVVYIPYRTNQPVLGADRAVAGILVDISGSLDLNTFMLTVGGDVAVDGQVTNGVIDVTGAGTQLYGSVPNLNLAAPRSMTGPLYVNGNVTLLDVLTVGPFLLEVLGDLSVEALTGTIVMDDPRSYTIVRGNTSFGGGSHIGALTDGIFQVYGNFTVNTTNDPIAFRSDGTVVGFYGTGDQTVTLVSPAPGEQAFQDLEIVKSGGSLVLGSDVVVEGDFYAYGSTVTRGLRTTFSLQLYGGAQVTQTTFNGLPLAITTSATPGSIFLSGITFTQMSTTQTQLYIAIPGAGPASPLQIQSPVFDINSPPAQGFYYLHVANTTQAATLEVQVTNPTPFDQPSEVSTQGVGLVNLIWPY